MKTKKVTKKTQKSAKKPTPKPIPQYLEPTNEDLLSERYVWEAVICETFEISLVAGATH